MILSHRVSATLLISWLIVATLVVSRVPLMPRTIRHGWYEDTNAHYIPVLMARGFVREEGRTPYFLFPKWSARPDGEPWLLYTSWPPLGFYALTPIVAMSRGPRTQIVAVRLVMTLAIAVASWLVFCLFRIMTRNDGLALVAQAVSTFELDRYYFADLSFPSQFGYVLGLLQTLLILAIVGGHMSRRRLLATHVASATAALTWWSNSLIPLTAVALSYVLKVPPKARRALWGVALSSTGVALGTVTWLAVAEITTTGIRGGTGVLGAGLRGFAHYFGDLLNLTSVVSPALMVQTYLEFLLRFVVPLPTTLMSHISIGQQMTALGLLPRYTWTIDQLVTLPLAIALFGLFGVLAVRGTRSWLARRSDVDGLQIPKFGLLLFVLPGALFVALLPGWTYGHPPYGRMSLAPVGVVLAVGAYQRVRQIIPRRGMAVLAGWLVVWASFGVSLTYSMVKTFDDSYNRAELAALDWFREHARPGSVLMNNLPAFDGLHSTFALFHADAKAYNWLEWPAKLAFPDGFIGMPTPAEALPYLRSERAALTAAGRDERSEAVRRRIQALEEAVVESARGAGGEGTREQLLGLYGQVLADVRALGRASSVATLLPRGWDRHDNYLLLREDFGLPPLFRGMDYIVKFESEFRTDPDVFMGGRTAYNFFCHEVERRQRVRIPCRHALRKAAAAMLRGDWQAVRSLSFIEAQPSHDAFEFPIRGGTAPVGRLLLVKLEGERRRGVRQEVSHWK